MPQNISDNKGRKYALLSEEMYKALKHANQAVTETESPEFTKVRKLDDRIKRHLTE